MEKKEEICYFLVFDLYDKVPVEWKMFYLKLVPNILMKVYWTF